MERRQHKRWPRTFRVVALMDSLALEGDTHDISQSGMRLNISSPPPVKNVEFPLSISLPFGRQEMTAEFLWSKPNPTGGYQAGIHLISVPAEYLNFTATMKYHVH